MEPMRLSVPEAEGESGGRVHLPGAAVFLLNDPARHSLIPHVGPIR